MLRLLVGAVLTLGPLLALGFPTCQLCYPGTSGACQQSNNGVCFQASSTTGCPTGTSLCACPGCSGGSTGQCKKSDGTCVAYSNMATAACPAGSVACNSATSGQPACVPCYSGTSGPCQQSNGVCWSKTSGVCPVGSYECVTAVTPTRSSTKSVTVSRSASRTASRSRTPSLSASQTPSLSESLTPSISVSNSPSISESASTSPSVSESVSESPSVSESATPSVSESNTPSVSESMSLSESASVTPTVSLSPTTTPLPVHYFARPVFASSTSSSSASHEVGQAFDRVNSGTYWEAATGHYDPTTGVATSAISTVVDGIAVYGDWIQCKYSNSLSSTGYVDGMRLHIEQTQVAAAPVSWMFAFSDDDGVSWIHDLGLGSAWERNNYNWGASSRFESFSGTGDPHTHIRMIVTKVAPGAAAPVVAELTVYYIG